MLELTIWYLGQFVKFETRFGECRAIYVLMSFLENLQTLQKVIESIALTITIIGGHV